MRRTTIRPFGQSTLMPRLVSMIMALAVLWALYYRLRDPATWRIFVEESASAPDRRSVAAEETETEDVVPGPNDLDEREVSAIGEVFELVTDRAPLKSREMDAYWRLMDWSRTQPFAELAQRAKADVPFTQLWEQPDLYRGKPIRLRLHVRRILEYDAPENPSGIAKVHEAWGWTDESRSFPYVVVFPAPVRNLPIGTDIHTEIEFVGYFLKIMTYTAFDHSRGAPLLVGRARVVSTPAAPAPIVWDRASILLVAAAAVVILAMGLWFGLRSGRKAKLTTLPKELSPIELAEGLGMDQAPNADITNFPKMLT